MEETQEWVREINRRTDATVQARDFGAGEGQGCNPGGRSSYLVHFEEVPNGYALRIADRPNGRKIFYLRDK